MTNKYIQLKSSKSLKLNFLLSVFLNSSMSPIEWNLKWSFLYCEVLGCVLDLGHGGGGVWVSWCEQPYASTGGGALFFLVCASQKFNRKQEAITTDSKPPPTHLCNNTNMKRAIHIFSSGRPRIPGLNGIARYQWSHIKHVQLCWIVKGTKNRYKDLFLQ